jgi:serine/threonine-protein kinase
MSFEIGRTYGSYEFIDVLETSKEGITYKVKNVLAGRLEVLKALPGGSQNDQDRVERFLREVRVHAGLLHPNIITFYNATELEGRIVMTSELVEGTALAARLELGPLPWMEALECMSGVLSALGHAHAHGIVHRDLTPVKIILTPDGAVRLGGFGLAKGIADPHLTVAGALVGSLKYMSPEQVKGVQQLDGRTDLYSAGVVLYEMLVGKPPFDSKSQFDIMTAHVNTIPAPPSVMRHELPQLLDAIVMKGLAKDPAERFQTADAFRLTLQAVKSPVAASPVKAAAEPAQPPVGPQSAPRPPEPMVTPDAVPAVLLTAPAAMPAVTEPVMPAPALEPVFSATATTGASIPRELMLAAMLVFLIGVVAFLALR